MEITIRQEEMRDYATMERLVRDAFWDKYSPGCSEHWVVHAMRPMKETRRQLCCVAEADVQLAGGIWYAEAVIHGAKGDVPVLTMGPVAVKPELQGKGIGAALIRQTLEKASSMDYPAVIIYGNAAYYSRFGFQSSEQFGVTDAEGNPCPAILVCPLRHSVVPSGAFDEGAPYHVTPQDVRAFDKTFEARQKHVRSSQLFFVFPEPPPSDGLLKQSWELRMKATAMLRYTGVVKAWENMGAAVRLVGSYRSNLMAVHRDVDMHVYTPTLDVAETLRGLEPLLSQSFVTKLTFVNRAETDEKCLEWHLKVKDEQGEEWKLDMIQILADSRLDGHFEDITDAISDALTSETRQTIIALKAAAPESEPPRCGIAFCKAVLADHVQTWEEFRLWEKDNPLESLYDWKP